jgi:hypothetical protein
MERPTNPEFIAYPGTKDELWWTGSDWVKPPTAPAPAGTTLADVVSVYATVRDKRAAKKREWEAEDAALDEDLRKLRVHMLALLNQTGAKSIATQYGTVYRTERLKPSAADWSAVYNWIVADPDRFEILEKRLKSTFVSEYMDEHDGELPPGVNAHREYDVSVRRS